MIEIKDIRFNYGNIDVLKNINITLEEGKIYGLLGENGVGKTTLLTLLCGLKQPKSGSIITDGLNPFDRLPSFLSDQYYLSDEVAANRMSALSFAEDFGKFWYNFDINKFKEVMSIFDMNTEQRMNQMSFGQLKKTYISFSLACNTKYIFMDEPTNGLDIPSKAQFRKAIMKYTREDSTIVISTHQVKDLENLIDPIIILDRQDVLLNASIEKITDKLYFDYGSNKIQDALYSEMYAPGGYVQVAINSQMRESKVNLEALFNTVLNHKSLIKGVFNNE